VVAVAPRRSASPGSGVVRNRAALPRIVANGLPPAVIASSSVADSVSAGHRSACITAAMSGSKDCAFEP
jgi:hypothetical protein